MLYPGAQAPAEHRKNVSAPRNRRADTTMHPWQSGHQLGAQSRHHPGASFPLARGDSSIIISTCPNNLKPVSTFAGEDQFALYEQGKPPLGWLEDPVVIKAMGK